MFLLATFAVGCGSSATPLPSPEPNDTPPSAAPATPLAFPVLTVETRGGECAQGACDRLLNIEADGRIHEVIPKDRIVGMVPPEVIEALRTEVEQADFVAIRGRPFTDTCPIAFDGQQVIYTFHVKTGDREIDSCEVAIDPADPLFVAVDAALKFEAPSN